MFELRKLRNAITLELIAARLSVYAADMALKDVNAGAEQALAAVNVHHAHAVVAPAAARSRFVRYVCTYPQCLRPGHTEERCYLKNPHLRIVRDQQWAADNGVQRANVAVVALPAAPFLERAVDGDAFVIDGHRAYLATHHALRAVGISAAQSFDAMLDSGASVSMLANKDFFTDLKDCAPVTVYIADGSPMVARQSGTIHIACKDRHGNDRPGLPVYDVLYMEALSVNLISLAQLLSMDNVRPGWRGRNITLASGDDIISTTTTGGGLLHVVVRKHLPAPSLASPPLAAPPFHTIVAVARVPDIDTWHRRFGHLNEDAVRLVLAKVGRKKGNRKHRGKKRDGILAPSTLSFCEPCAMGSPSVHPSSVPLAILKTVLGRIHSDICGPFTTSNQGREGVITFIDDHSRRASAQLLKHKSDAFDALLLDKARVEKELERTEGTVKTVTQDEVLGLMDGLSN